MKLQVPYHEVIRSLLQKQMKYQTKDKYSQKKIFMRQDYYHNIKKDNFEVEVTQSSKFRTKTWVEINVDAEGTYNTNGQTKFKTTMLKLSIYDYSDA